MNQVTMGRWTICGHMPSYQMKYTRGYIPAAIYLLLLSLKKCLEYLEMADNVTKGINPCDIYAPLCNYTPGAHPVSIVVFLVFFGVQIISV